MPTNLHLANDIRDKIVSAMKADSALLAMVPRIYPARVPGSPERPFVKMGAPITTPIFIDGKNGTQTSAAIHIFVNTIPGTINDGEVFANQACAEIVRILEGMESITIGDGLTLDVFPRQAQCMQDGDDDSWHGFVTFDAQAG